MEMFLELLLVTDEKYGVDIFLGIGGGPEGVLAASALDALIVIFKEDFYLILIKINQEQKKWV